MQDTILLSYEKTVFWQRVLAGAITLTLLLGVIFFLYYFSDSAEYRLYFEREKKDTYLGIALLTTAFLGLCLLIYFNWLLFRSGKYLKKYTLSKGVNDLESAFKYQTLFWRILALFPFITASLILLLLLSFTIIDHTIPDEVVIFPFPGQSGPVWIN